jgi:hypothetical protein
MNYLFVDRRKQEHQDPPGRSWTGPNVAKQLQYHGGTNKSGFTAGAKLFRIGTERYIPALTTSLVFPHQKEELILVVCLPKALPGFDNVRDAPVTQRSRPAPTLNLLRSPRDRIDAL